MGLDEDTPYFDRFNSNQLAFRSSGPQYYIEMAGTPGVPRNDVERELEEMSAVILEELLRPDVNGLKRP